MKILVILAALSQLMPLTELVAQPKNFQSIESALEVPERVEWLTLRNQGLESFPVEITRFKNLKYHDLSGNNINSLPDQVG